MPAPYGSVYSYSGGTSGGTLIIRVPIPLPTNWATAPTNSLSFPITIGTERMLATFASQQTFGTYKLLTYTVVRDTATWGTTAIDMAVAVTSQALVMLNPLPLGGDGKQMQMCTVDEGWGAVDPSLCPTPAPSGSEACVQKSTTEDDLGDGYMIGN